MQKYIILFFVFDCFILSVGGRLGINVDLENNNNGVSVGEAKELFRTVEDYLGFESNGKVDTLRLFNFDSSVTELITSFLSLDNLKEIYLGIQNSQLSGFRGTILEEFQSTVSTITDTRPDISLTFVVGDEPFLNGFGSSDVEATVDVLKDNYPQVPVIIPCSMGTLSVSFPVESGQFSNDFISSYSSVLTKVDAFGVNPYPFYTIFDDESITLETTAGEDMQMLTQQLQATQAALARENLNLELVVTATGWPSFGSNEFATPENNYQYFSNVARFALDEQTSSGLLNHLFLHELVDQPLKGSEGEKDAFGIFDSEGNFKISAPTNQPTFVPSNYPSFSPTSSPEAFSFAPSRSPSLNPTEFLPTSSPTQDHKGNSTESPTNSNIPTLSPTISPNKVLENEGDSTGDQEATDLLVLASTGGLLLLASILCVLLIRSKLNTRTRKKYLRSISQDQGTLMDRISASGSIGYLDAGSTAHSRPPLSLSSVGPTHSQVQDLKTSYVNNSVLSSATVHYQFYPSDDEGLLSPQSGIFTELHNSNPLYTPNYSRY
eukprot:snap_masked-scaffold_11-processed-gene-12.64-mRNA-1 protein AED:1.00 eAED:1.00 QI:0/-1/0/0/-1/1/1/0/548